MAILYSYSDLSCRRQLWLASERTSTTKSIPVPSYPFHPLPLHTLERTNFECRVAPIRTNNKGSCRLTGSTAIFTTEKEYYSNKFSDTSKASTNAQAKPGYLLFRCQFPTVLPSVVTAFMQCCSRRHHHPLPLQRPLRHCCFPVR